MFYVAVGVLIVTGVVHAIIDNDDILVLAYVVTDFQFGPCFYLTLILKLLVNLLL